MRALLNQDGPSYACPREPSVTTNLGFIRRDPVGQQMIHPKKKWKKGGFGCFARVALLEPSLRTDSPRVAPVDCRPGSYVAGSVIVPEEVNMRAVVAHTSRSVETEHVVVARDIASSDGTCCSACTRSMSHPPPITLAARL